MRVLVTGSGTWADYEKMSRALLPWFSFDNILVSGHCAEGADAMAERLWAGWLGMDLGQAMNGGYIEAYSADWRGPCRESCREGHRRWKNGRTYCPAAGNYRNAEMVAKGASACLAFACWCRRWRCEGRSPHYTHGTQDCFRKADGAGIPVTWTVEDE